MPTRATAPSDEVYVISGPTAVGKGTLVKRLHTRHPEIFVSVSATTRPPRPGEREGVEYHFLDDRAFDELIATDGLLEWASIHGRARYGTPREPVLAALARGAKVILEIDLQGARQVRRQLPGAHYIFIAPPSWPELVHRLQGRGTETPEQMDARLRTAEGELEHASEFDTVVVNDELEEAVAELVSCMGLSDQAPGPSCEPGRSDPSLSTER